ncbi:unnamed protein product [Clonostachys solani]|uniref:Uncharacterized protein n=1 Tax=Clonostachys solani TaxID=160281 RepID=A0A9N9W2B4_9HYPO|nr:unnamed protein product [Clonostachys solani]
MTGLKVTSSLASSASIASVTAAITMAGFKVTSSLASSAGIASVAAVAMASPEVRLLAGATSSEKFGFARGKVAAIKLRFLSSDA